MNSHAVRCGRKWNEWPVYILDFHFRGNGIPHLRSNGALGLPCYATDRVELAFDYTLSLGADLEIRIGDVLLDVISGSDWIGGGPDHYEQLWDLVPLGVGDCLSELSLTLKAAGDPHLYLDNLTLTNAGTPESPVPLPTALCLGLAAFMSLIPFRRRMR